MGTIAENLLALQQTKENFKTAFAEKEVDLTDVPFTEYPNKFAEIKTSEDLDTELEKQEEILSELETEANALSDKGDFDVESVIDEAKGTQTIVINGKNKEVEPLDITANGEYNVVRYKKVNVNVADMLQARVDDTNSCYYLFYYYGGTSLDLSNLDTSNVTNMRYMFNYCSNLTNITFGEKFDTRNVTHMVGMFSSCHALQTLDLSHFNTSNVNSMSYMFQSCQKLTSLNLSSFNTSNVISMEYMFNNCFNLTSLNLSNWDTSNVTSMTSMFQGCGLTGVLDLSHFDMSKVNYSTNMFTNCTALTHAILPSKIKKMDSNFFYGCTSLTEFTILAETPPTLANINSISTATTSIYVPDASVDAYKGATNWSAYADKIKPLSSKGV